MKAAFVIFDRMTSLDFIGFYDPVTRLRSMKIMDDFEWRICSSTKRVVDDRGLQLEADAVAEPLSSYDMLFVPGGFGTRKLQHDRSFLDWLKTARSAPLKLSVCTGALLLGAAGFLRGRRATTHPSAYKELEPYCGAVVQERVVDEGDIITARGVSSAIDLGLHVVQRLAGADARAHREPDGLPIPVESMTLAQFNSSLNRAGSTVSQLTTVATRRHNNTLSHEVLGAEHDTP